MKIICTVALTCLSLCSSALAADPTALFKEVTNMAGLSVVYAGDWQYMVGGGAAAFDCNNDGMMDLFLAGGEGPSGFYRNVSKRGGDIRFKPMKAGLEFKSVVGAYPLDVDGDGIKDLVVLRVGENYVMRGRGNCKFEKANKAWGFDGGDGWSTALAATWEKGSNWPTIAIGNYIDRTKEEDPWGSCTDNWLHRPDGAKKRFAPPLALKPSFCTLSMLFSDWNKSGTPSLRMANDREYYEGGQEQLWKMPPGEAPSLYTEAEGWKYLRIWGMGIASYDLNFDGFPEYAITSMADNKIQTLAELPADGSAPKPSFKDVAYPKHATAHRPYEGDDWHPSTAWHVQFEDVNNDGFADLFMAKGNVDRMPDFAQKDPNNLLMGQADGTFREAGHEAGVDSMSNSRGAALADFNLDGRVDLVVTARRQPARVWQNVTETAGHWIEMQLAQDSANAGAVGARFEVKRGDGKIMSREVLVGGGQAGGALGWIHMGLGDMANPEVRVVWPDGKADDWHRMQADRLYVCRRGQAPSVF